MSDRAVDTATQSTTTRTAFLIAAEPTLATSEAVEAHAAGLRELGVLGLTALAGPGHTIVHVESDGLAGEDSGALATGVLDAVLVDPAAAPVAVAFPEIFAWDAVASEADVAVAIMLRLKPDAAADYRAWLGSGVVDTLKQIWARGAISRHDVLQAGDTVVGYYSCAGPAAVTAAFADPAGVAVMEQGLGDLLDLEATAALPILEEKITWNA